MQFSTHRVIMSQGSIDRHHLKGTIGGGGPEAPSKPAQETLGLLRNEIKRVGIFHRILRLRLTLQVAPLVAHTQRQRVTRRGNRPAGHSFESSSSLRTVIRRQHHQQIPTVQPLRTQIALRRSAQLFLAAGYKENAQPQSLRFLVYPQRAGNRRRLRIGEPRIVAGRVVSNSAATICG